MEEKTELLSCIARLMGTLQINDHLPVMLEKIPLPMRGMVSGMMGGMDLDLVIATLLARHIESMDAETVVWVLHGLSDDSTQTG
ncbi:MAG: hypothetical protein ACYCT2_09050 [Thermoplasmataceae archaeon]